MIPPLPNSLAPVISSVLMATIGITQTVTSASASAPTVPLLLAQVSCVTDIAEMPTANTDVTYVTEATACFDEKDGILIENEVFAIEYDPTVDYFYIDYDGVRWYFVYWNNVLLLTNGSSFVEVEFVS